MEGQILVQPGFGQNVREWDKRLYTVSVEMSRPSSTLTLDRPCSPYLLNGPIENDNDVQTNEIFSKLLANEGKVHFAQEPPHTFDSRY